MVFRLTVSLLALATVLMVVFCEFYLSYSGVLGFRDDIYSKAYDALSSSTLDEELGDAMLTVLIFTLPECLATLLLYHVYAMLGRLMGLAPVEEPSAY